MHLKKVSPFSVELAQQRTGKPAVTRYTDTFLHILNVIFQLNENLIEPLADMKLDLDVSVIIYTFMHYNHVPTIFVHKLTALLIHRDGQWFIS